MIILLCRDGNGTSYIREKLSPVDLESHAPGFILLSPGAKEDDSEVTTRIYV